MTSHTNKAVSDLKCFYFLYFSCEVGSTLLRLLLFVFLPHQHARAACSPLSPSSRLFRHWSGMMSSTVKTIEPTPPSVSPHTRIAAQSDTRSDVTPAELAKHS